MNEDVAPNLLERTGSSLLRAWRDMVDAARLRLTSSVRPDLPEDDLPVLRRQIDDCLEARGGEVSARARAAELGQLYLELSGKGRRNFLRLLAAEYGVDREALTVAMSEAQMATEAADIEAAHERLRTMMVSPRIRLLRQFNSLDQGVKFLVDLRADLIEAAQEDPALAPFERELRDLLATWFDVGFLELRRVTWDAPASFLEKLVEYEAVHEIASWTNLKHRLVSDRRSYAFIHPAMPAEPLIFVEVALVEGLAENVHELLDQDAPDRAPTAADTAVFYSISNTQRGLRGISFGSFLIKRVADDVSRELPNIRRFATLSPIPGFMKWLRRAAQDDEPLLTGAERSSLAKVVGSGNDPLMMLLARDGWHLDERCAEALRPVLLRLCARYLVRERRGDGSARDPVAHFHLSNGARIERINWLGDVSPKGRSQSAGMMVNYLYRLDEIEANHEAYAGDGIVAASGAVQTLAAGR